MAVCKALVSAASDAHDASLQITYNNKQQNYYKQKLYKDKEEKVKASYKDLNASKINVFLSFFLKLMIKFELFT